MSATGLDVARAAAQSSILKKFTAAYENAARSASSDPEVAKRGAARIALEYAVIKTAMEKNVPTQVVAQALEGENPQEQAMLVREGRAAIERTYGRSPDLMAGALAGKVVEVPVPKTLAWNPEFDKLVDAARNSVAKIVQDEYSSRGRLADFGPRSEQIETAAHGKTSALRGELASRLAFIDSAIDAAVERGQMGADRGKAEEAAAMLKDRVEKMVFEPRPPQSLSYTQTFLDYYKSAGQQMRSEVMASVHAVTQSKTIEEIGAKLDQTMKALERTRPDKGMER